MLSNLQIIMRKKVLYCSHIMDLTLKFQHCTSHGVTTPAFAHSSRTESNCFVLVVKYCTPRSKWTLVPSCAQVALNVSSWRVQERPTSQQSRRKAVLAWIWRIVDGSRTDISNDSIWSGISINNPTNKSEFGIRMTLRMAKHTDTALQIC